MRQGIAEELDRVIIILIITTLIGIFTGYLLEAWASGVVFYSAWLLFQTRAFYLWIEENNKDTAPTYPPNHGGIWGDIFDIIYRFRSRNNLIKRELEQQLEEVQGSMNALKNGVVSINDHDHLLWWNPEAEKLLGFKEQFDKGKPIHNLLRNPKFIDYLHAKDFNKTVTIPSPIVNGSVLEIQVTVFRNQQKLLMVQDISRLIRLEQMRKDFVANVSHELRTPLTVINGYIEMLNDNVESFSSEWQTPIKKITSQSLRMTEIVEDLSTLSRLDSQENLIECSEVQIKPLLLRICKDAKDLRTDIDINLAGENFCILGSERELHSCFSNLIFNAVKYSKTSGLHLHIELEQTESKKIVRFTDDGIGIDPVHIPRLTERFYRADKSHSKQTGGTGLGLAIVKHVLLRHHGELTITSKLGKGSIFTCSFND